MYRGGWDLPADFSEASKTVSRVAHVPIPCVTHLRYCLWNRRFSMELGVAYKSWFTRETKKSENLRQD